MYLMGALQLQSCSPSFCDHASVSGMAFQNRDPVAASVTAAHKAAEPSGGAARSPLDNRLQQELMAGDVMSGDKGIFAFPESDSLIKWVETIHRAASTVYEGLRYKLSLELPRGYLYNAPTREVPHALLPPPTCTPRVTSAWTCSLPYTTSGPNTMLPSSGKSPLPLRSICKETYAKQVSSQEP